MVSGHKSLSELEGPILSDPMCILVGTKVNAVVFSRDGMQIVSGLDDGTVTVRVWEASTARAVLNGGIDYVYLVALSRDGTHWQIVSGSEETRVWDPSTGAMNVLRGHTNLG